MEEVKPESTAKKPKFKLEELQRYVGGYIELVRLPKHRNMVVNEEGKLRGLGINYKATEIVQKEAARPEIIVGDVLICGPGEM